MSFVVLLADTIRKKVAAISYLLNAPFTGADQGYANGQVLDSAAEGVTVGQLTVVEVDGTLALVSNKCAFTAQGSPVWGDLGFYSQVITRALGRAVLFVLNKDANNDVGPLLGFRTDQAANNLNYEGRASFSSAGNVDLSDVAHVIDVFAYSAATDYSLAIVLGGYDASLVPWRSGQAEVSYPNGCAYFIKGSAFATWTLVWRSTQGTTATLYAFMGNHSATGTIDAFRVPDTSLSAVLQPTCLSTFTASNGTSLDAITPEVGGAWTEREGAWDIQSNLANCAAPDVGNYYATTESSVADVLVDATAKSTTTISSSVGIVVRWVDSTHNWWCDILPGANQNRIVEHNGSATVRASGAVTIAANTTYSLRVIAHGTTISFFVHGGSKITYSSASSSQSATAHGLRGQNDLDVFDNFTVYARTSAVYDAAFDAV